MRSAVSGGIDASSAVGVTGPVASTPGPGAATRAERTDARRAGQSKGAPATGGRPALASSTNR